MFNMAVLRLKDIIKYGIVFIISLSVIVFCTNSFIEINNKKASEVKRLEKPSFLANKSFVEILDQTVPEIENINGKYKKDNLNDKAQNNNNILEIMLKTQISSIKGMEKIEENQKNEELAVNKNQEDNTKTSINDESSRDEQKTEIAQAGVTTQVITQNPIAEKSNAQYGKVKIKNETDYELTQDMLKPDISIDNKNVIIFHTHSCESYTSSEKYPYIPTGTYRTTDLNYTVTRVGTELESQLKSYNFNVIHNKDYHDYPSYNGSYTRSLKTVDGILQTMPSDIIIDLHRDAVGSRSDYAPTVKIGGEEAAQIMFVIGTNNGGLWHPNWNQNLKFAVKVQEKAEELYPGLFKPIMLTKSRYNQHTGKYANIIEVGATGNTLEQCLNSMKYLAKIMNEIT